VNWNHRAFSMFLTTGGLMVACSIFSTYDEW